MIPVSNCKIIIKSDRKLKKYDNEYETNIEIRDKY